MFVRKLESSNYRLKVGVDLHATTTSRDNYELELQLSKSQLSCDSRWALADRLKRPLIRALTLQLVDGLREQLLEDLHVKAT